MLDGLHAYADSRKCVPLLALVDIAANLGNKLPQNPNFGGMNKHFQARSAKY